VALTVGEPLANPSFDAVLARVRARGLRFDLHTNGRLLGAPGAVSRLVDAGLDRALVSLHSHRADVAAEVGGSGPAAHGETLAGIAALVAGGVDVLLNCVLTRLNLREAGALLDFVAARFGRACAVKVAFPSLFTGARSWAPIHLTYAEVGATVRGLPARARALGLRLAFEAFPSCVLGDAEHRPTGRLGFGETHYLDDAAGDRLLSVAWIDSRANVFARECVACRAFERCAGVAWAYVALHGTGELRPFPNRAAWWAVDTRGRDESGQTGPGPCGGAG